MQESATWNLTWLLEMEVSEAAMKSLAASATRTGQEVVRWEDELKLTPPSLGGPVLFHGSLGNAKHCYDFADWSPGAFCDVARTSMGATLMPS